MFRARPRRSLALTAAALATVAACGGGSTRPSTSVDAVDWQAVLKAAHGQTVNWYMYGGDEALNGFVAGPLSDRLQRYGVTINQVKLTDTVDAVNKVLAEKQAGRNSSGAVDLIWLNGENFATGKQANLWRCGYDRKLPNATHVNATDPAIAYDFGMPVDGCESPWQQADSALVYNRSALRTSDVASVSSLLAWARRHPGRFTYPALPDFTGSMAVRTVLYDTSGGPERFTSPLDEAVYGPAASRLWQRLNSIEPTLWRAGKTYPSSQDDVEKLYANGEIDAFFTYGPGAVTAKVAKGVFPATTREAVLSVGNIANTSFVAIPHNAAHTAAAMVLANELLDPAMQLALFKADGAYPAIAVDSLAAADRRAFEQVDLGPSVLTAAQLTAHTRPELPSAYVTRLEADWKTHVQRQ
jgi:putative spermidine/putrescine transport system substrate-binding protein